MSPKSLPTSTILRAIHEQALGFTFGTPDRPNSDALACLLPILRETSHRRQYVTYPETDGVLVSDSGSINRVNVKNATKDNVFLRSGTMFEGKGTQSRALTRSAIVFPGTEVALDVRCIHASHGIRSGSEFKYSGVTPLSMDSTFYSAGYRPADQATMWNNVQSFTASVSGSTPTSSGIASHAHARRLTRQMAVQRLGPPRRIGAAGASSGRGWSSTSSAMPNMDAYEAHIPSGDDLRQHFDQFASSFDGVLSKARLHDNQAGIALITDKGCQTLELFDVPLSWEALHKDAVKRMGTELLRGPDKANVFEYKPDHAIAAAQKVLALDYLTNVIYEHRPSNGEPHVAVYGLTADGYVGESVEIGGDVMHLVLLQTA